MKKRHLIFQLSAFAAVAAAALAFVVFLSRTQAVSAENVTLIKNLQYFAGDGANPDYHVLDLYVPEGVHGFPTVVFAHGGAWQAGKKSSAGPESFSITMANAGIACANINYRLSPEVKHPEHSRDFARAVRFVRDEIAGFGGDPDKLFLAGHSAGAHLAALVALDKKYLAEAGVPETAIRGAIPISGPFDLSRRDFEFFKWLKLDKVFEDDDARRDATVFNYVRSDAPPMLIFAAELESLYVISDAESLSDALARAGAHAEYRLIPLRNHGTILRRFGAKMDMTSDLTLKFIRRKS